MSFASLLLNLLENSCQSSESSSDEDFDEFLRFLEKQELRPGVLNYPSTINSYSPEDFKKHFLLSRERFDYLHNIIEDLVRNGPGSPAIPSRDQLAITLWRMASMDSFRSISDRFNVRETTAQKCVRCVSDALFKRSYRFIHWPVGDGAIEVMRGFERLGGFPKTIGALDVTDIRIIAPRQNSEIYINRKRFHSIQLQIVCDHRAVITQCHAGYPGSINNQNVFRLTPLSDFTNNDNAFPEDSHILGDEAYEIHQHLLTPYPNNGHLSEKQKKYNSQHSETRVPVQRCIDLLKGRMKSLSQRLRMSRLDLIPKYIVACCVIHNVNFLTEEELNIITRPDFILKNKGNDSHVTRRNAGIVKRDALMNSW